MCTLHVHVHEQVERARMMAAVQQEAQRIAMQLDQANALRVQQEDARAHQEAQVGC
jgi:hypothetical protein